MALAQESKITESVNGETNETQTHDTEGRERDGHELAERRQIWQQIGDKTVQHPNEMADN